MVWISPLPKQPPLSHPVAMSQYRRNPVNVERVRQMRRAMTSAETTIWSVVRRRQLGWKFRRQEPIGPYIVDFVCMSRRLIVEMDGDGHGGTYDTTRNTYLSGLRFWIFHFDNDDLTEPAWVKAEIRDWIEDLERI